MKVQVNLADELVQRIDEYARRTGVSRSAWCAFMIGQGILATERSETVIAKLAENAQMSFDDFFKGMMTDSEQELKS